MKPKKLISIRLDSDLCDVFDNYALLYSHWTRSSVINHLLRVMIDCASPGTISNMLNSYYAKERGMQIEFKEPQSTP